MTSIPPGIDSPDIKPELQLVEADGVLHRVLRRMGEKSDFPALSESLVRIQRVTNSESANLANLSDEIMKDVALTNKLLRIVNSAHDSAGRAGAVTTVSRAAALIGFAGIRNMALSLVLLEHMRDKSHAKQIQAEFLRALMAAALAHELSSTGRDGEEAFIGAMFLNLGRLLTQYYLPEEAQSIRESLCAVVSAPNEGDGQAEAAVSRRVLGLSFEDLGLGVAQSWGLPPTLMNCMRRPAGDPPLKLAEKGEDRVRWLSLAAGEMTDALLEEDPKESHSRVASIAKRYRRVLGHEVGDFEAAALGARERVTEMAQAMHLHLDADSPARRLLLDAGLPLLPAVTELPIQGATHVQVAKAVQSNERATHASEVMAAGIQNITNSLVDAFQLDDVLREILQVMQRALDFRQVLLCLRDLKGETLAGKLGVGSNAQASAACFKVSLSAAGDLFSVVCNKGVDTLISDATLANMAQRLPAWYRASINAPAFLLLPLQVKAKPFGLIYADKEQAGAIELSEKELAQLRTLRNQAVMAFRQSS